MVYMGNDGYVSKVFNHGVFLSGRRAHTTGFPLRNQSLCGVPQKAQKDYNGSVSCRLPVLA
jgi:hypothetical protein